MGWRMVVDGSMQESRDMSKGYLSTSDNACYVNKRADIVGEYLAQSKLRIPEGPS